MQYSQILAVAALVSSTQATTAYLGFNSGSTHADGSSKVKADFVKEFTNAANLEGAPGTFNSIRLYTNVQGGTTNTPIEAFEAAVETKTSILLGIWASGTTSIANELTALNTALTNLGDDFANLVIGISIGSEDLYRNSATGVTNEAGIGADPDTIVGFIKDYKKKFADTSLANVPIGHVDTWDAFTNSSNSAVLDAVDWLGVDEYPYYQTGDGNSIENNAKLFKAAYDAVVGVAGGKTVWVTETGFPYEGKTWDEAVPSVANAKTYWDEVGCEQLFNKVPTFWYNFVEDNGANAQKFAITDDGSSTARFNLTCPATTSSDDDDTSSTSTATSTGKSSSSTGTSSSKGTSNGTTTASGSAATSTGSSSGSSSSSSSSSDSSSESSTTSDSSSSSTTSAVAASGALKMGSSAFAGVALTAAAVFALL